MGAISASKSMCCQGQCFKFNPSQPPTIPSYPIPSQALIESSLTSSSPATCTTPQLLCSPAHGLGLGYRLIRRHSNDIVHNLNTLGPQGWGFILNCLVTM